MGRRSLRFTTNPAAGPCYPFRRKPPGCIRDHRSPAPGSIPCLSWSHRRPTDRPDGPGRRGDPAGGRHRSCRWAGRLPDRDGVRPRGERAGPGGDCYRVFAAKGRPATNPLIVHVDGESMLRAVAATWPPAAAGPGHPVLARPLTLVLPERPDVPDVVTGGGPTVAVRMPAHPRPGPDPGGRAVPWPPRRRTGRRSCPDPGRARAGRARRADRPDPRRRADPERDRVDGAVAGRRVPVLLRPGPIPVNDWSGSSGRSCGGRAGRGDRLPLRLAGMLARCAPRRGGAARRPRKASRTGRTGRPRRGHRVRGDRGGPGLVVRERCRRTRPGTPHGCLTCCTNWTAAAGRHRVLVELPPAPTNGSRYATDYAGGDLTARPPGKVAGDGARPADTGVRPDPGNPANPRVSGGVGSTHHSPTILPLVVDY